MKLAPNWPSGRSSSKEKPVAIRSIRLLRVLKTSLKRSRQPNPTRIPFPKLPLAHYPRLTISQINRLWPGKPSKILNSSKLRNANSLEYRVLIVGILIKVKQAVLGELQRSCRFNRFSKSHKTRKTIQSISEAYLKCLMNLTTKWTALKNKRRSATSVGANSLLKYQIFTRMNRILSADQNSISTEKAKARVHNPKFVK